VVGLTPRFAWVERVRRVPAHRWAERVALAAALVPPVVMIIRAITSRWVPLFDAAYFTVRSRDVATSHNPLVGAWSMGSREVGVWINNLGPLQLDVLAPFTKLDPYWGTALGVGIINIASIVGVWFVARRGFGSVGVIGAMGATVLLELNEGSLMLIEARQQLALVLPMWCLLWLASATWRGDRWTAPWLAFVSSFVLQTHFTYAYQTVAVTVAAVVALVVRYRSQLRDLLRPGIGCVAVVVVCWVQPLWDEVAGTGNMGNVFRQSGGSERSVGASKGLRILAESAFVPPFFTPGSMGDLLREGPRVSLWSAAVALIGWAVVLGVVIVVMHRRHRTIAAMGGVSLVALVSSCYAVAKIPPTEQFGIIAQNYYWAWPVAIFLGLTVAAAALRGPVSDLLRALAPRARAAAIAGFVAVVALGTIPLLNATNELPETDHEWRVSRFLARPLMDELGDGLDAIDFTAPVLVDLGGVRHVRYTLLTELQRRDLDFRFSPGSTDLSRFGRERCDDGSAGYLLTLHGGSGALRLNTTDTLLGTVPGLTQAQARRSTELADLFADALRDGTVTVDDEAVEDLAGDVPQLLVNVRENPGMSARHLSEFLHNWYNFEQVEVPANMRSELREWHELETAAETDRMAIYLREIPRDRDDRCDEVDPGDEFLSAR
jgi:hypothetical protein